LKGTAFQAVCYCCRINAASLAAEKLDFALLKGAAFSCADASSLFCHPEPTLVGEGSAVPTFAAACSATQLK
jgi:hypothetical protein